MKKSALLLPLLRYATAAFMIGFVSAGFLIIQINASLPDAQSIKSVELKIPLRVYSAEGLLISEFGNERRKPVAIEDIPQTLVNAVLASEDDNFFHHRGIDLTGLARAAIRNFSSGESQQGASTITMQVARNFFLSREKTYLRKLKEVLLAIKLEQILSKQEILSLYLNKIFLGHRAYGFGAAAEVYYGRELSDLSLAETAMLAGLPKAPSSNNPLRNPVRALQRRNYVLSRLKYLELINEQQYFAATDSPVSAEKHVRNADLTAPHIAEMVRAQLTEEFGEQAYWQGLDVYTTILAAPQRAAEQTLRAGLQAYDRRHGFRGPIATVDIDKLDVSRFETDEITSFEVAKFYAELLSEFPDSHDQVAALITETGEQSAIAQSRNKGQINLSLADAQWAKRHLTVNKLGDAPKSMAELLAIGDVVYVQPLPQTNEVEAAPDNSEPVEAPKWRLSQIPNISGALISIEPASGKILSLVGGYDFFLNKYNRAVQSIRQPGSNIKPFIYSASLDKDFTPATLISGAPIVMTDPSHGTVWRPENYSGKFFGPTRMREALTKSLNLVSIRLLRSIGIPFTREYLERFGLDMRRFSPSLTMALGSGGVTPLEMLSAYGTLANSGYRVEPYFIDHIVDRTGEVIFQAKLPRLCDQCYTQYLPQPEELEVAEGEILTAGSEASEDKLSGEGAFADPLADLPADPLADLPNDPLADLPNDPLADLPNDPLADLSNDPLADLPSDPLADLPDDLSTDPPAEIDGELVPETYEAPRVMDLANNYLTVSMLKDVVRRGTARKALALNRQDLAGKTGTTNDYVDAWFTGFNSKLATTVWVGFDEPRTMGKGEAGSVAALPIWVNYMRVALEDIEQDTQQLPEFIEEGFINKVSGQRTDEFDPEAVIEYFPIADMLVDGVQIITDPEIPETVPIELLISDEELFLEELLEEQNLEPQVEDQILESRIIEDDEDTEGLF